MDSDYIVIQNQNKSQPQQDFQNLQIPKEINTQKKYIQQCISVRLNDCFVVVTNEQSRQQFQNEIQWQEFLSKPLNQRLTHMNVVDLNSVIEVSITDVDKRKQIWLLLLKQKNQNNLSSTNENQNDQKIRIQFNQNIDKMMKKFTTEQTKQTQQIKKLILRILCQYENKQKFLGSIKGLQYICYGIYIASPVKQYQFVSQTFTYLMDIQRMKQIFQHGSPLYYKQLNILCRQFECQNKQLYSLLDEHVDWAKIFIAYYRSFLLNRIRNIEVISKIFDLLLVYGISIIRMILLNIISNFRQQFLATNDIQSLMRTFGTQLAYKYFQENMPARQCKEVQNQNLIENNKNQYNNETGAKLLRKLILRPI